LHQTFLGSVTYPFTSPHYPGEGNSYQFAVFIGNRTFLKLAAHDIGNGIAIEISDMIFDPFLTAK